ncbi:MAG TPA: hypothetical protein VMV22_00480 [Acidimicrobiales bacterium]|nr:hypothetical protein [Acidimicrobiales bacterium]
MNMVSHGWPQVRSSLKTLLETGDALPTGAAAPRRDDALRP